MRAVIQRVSNAKVSIGDMLISDIGKGYLILLGISRDDTEETADKLLSKIVRLRIFEDGAGKTNLSLSDVGGEALIISQFTLYADCKRGNRPSFTKAGSPEEAKALYEYFINEARKHISHVSAGKFGAMMDVSLTNQGPFTIMLDTESI